jgi:hypothetical protein
LTGDLLRQAASDASVTIFVDISHAGSAAPRRIKVRALALTLAMGKRGSGDIDHKRR